MAGVETEPGFGLFSKDVYKILEGSQKPTTKTRVAKYGWPKEGQGAS